MTYSKKSFSFLLLATALCGFLAGCGGDTNAPRGTYHNNHPDRTAAVNGNQKTLLAERVAKLETDVAMIKNDMSQLAMTYNGLMTTNERIDTLLTKIETDKVVQPASVVEKQDMMPPVKTETPKETKALPKETTVMGVRLGEHPDKTRMVIDWSKLGDVRTDLDNTEKLLIVTLSKTAWDAKETVSGLSSPLIAGWTVQDDSGAKTLVVQLKKPVKILNVDKLKAEKSQSARVVIDIASQ